MTCSALSPVFSHDWTQAGRWKFQDHPNSFCAPCADRTAPKTILTAATTQSPFVLIRFSNISIPILLMVLRDANCLYSSVLVPTFGEQEALHTVTTLVLPATTVTGAHYATCTGCEMVCR